MKPSISRLRVLIVDSDSAARRLYVDALRPLRCDAVEAGDGREALVEALVRRPSAVVMDSWLPIVDGAALCEILRRDPMTRTVPIVGIAAAADGRDELLRRAGASSVLAKPVEPGALAAELRRLIGSGAAAAPPAFVPPVLLTTGRTAGKRVANCRSHVRCTTTAPPVSPPELRCPICDSELLYERSYLGGVSQREAEQWDDYVCVACGTFEYRHRTRKLRDLSVAR